jgi:hypothetical protein
MAANSGGQQPEQTTFLGFPARPQGDGGAVQAGRQYWYELAGEIQGAFADIERAMGGMQWSGDARNAFDAVWSQFSGHGSEASQHSHEMGDHLFRVGGQIEDAQHQWDLAMGAMAASTAIGIGLTFFTFGISDEVAAGAAAAAASTMEGICAALEISMDALVQVLVAAVRIGMQLAVKFTWQFTIGVVSQEGANLVEGRGGLENLDLGQAAEFAGVSMLIPGMASRVTIGGRQVLAGVPGAIVTGAATDAAIQGVEGITEGKPFSVGEVLLSAALAGAGQKAGAALEGRGGAVPEVDPIEQAWRAKLTPEQSERQAQWDLAAADTARPENFSTIKEPLTGTLAQAIHDQSPGDVVAVGRRIIDPSFPGIKELTDLDIETRRAVIQVKSGAPAGLSRQLAASRTVTSKPSIGFAPEMTDGQLARYVTRGDIVFRDMPSLLAFLRGEH